MPDGGLTSRQIREAREARQPVDPTAALGATWERERTDTGVHPTLTVFLSGAECPFTCVFCDLWKHTLDSDTPRGAIPTQLTDTLDRENPVPADGVIKLYNASNFFDPRAVPSADLPDIARLLQPFKRVVVESHPRFVDARSADFGERLTGELEVALGLETVHLEAQSRINKGASLDDFDRAFEDLATWGVRVRAFVLLGAPFVAREESVEWTVASAQHALDRGAQHVSVIPTRGGNGALEILATRGDWAPPTMAEVERVASTCLTLPGVVTIDLWDIDRLSDCTCAPRRIDRLFRMNLSGTPQPAVACPSCGGSVA